MSASSPSTPGAPQSSRTARAGVRLVEDVLDAERVLSVPWEQSQDKGIDLISFVVDGEEATSFVLGIQVKSGKSAWNILVDNGRRRRGNRGEVEVSIHEDYWRSSTLPVFLMTADPITGDAYIEDAFSALLAPNRSSCMNAAETKIYCRVPFRPRNARGRKDSKIACHVRMRARVHALLPEMSTEFRRKSLYDVQFKNPMKLLSDTYRKVLGTQDTSSDLSWQPLLGLAELIRWTKRDVLDWRELESFCQGSTGSAAHSESRLLMGLVADAVAQWSVALGDAPEFTVEMESIVALLVDLFESACGSASRTIKGRRLLVGEVLSALGLPNDPLVKISAADPNYFVHQLLLGLHFSNHVNMRSAVEKTAETLRESELLYKRKLVRSRHGVAFRLGEYVPNLATLALEASKS